jgi:TonB family protein
MRFWPAVFALSVSLTLAFGQSNYNDALEKYKNDLQTNPRNSLAHFRIGEIYFLQGNHQSASNEFREALAGDLDPKWIAAWSHINLGKIYDLHQQCDRAVNEYRSAVQTNDNERGALEEANQYLYANSIRAFAPQPETEDDLRPVRTANRTTNVMLPLLIHQTAPVYSDEALLAGLEGTVLISGVVAKDGSTRDLRVARPLGLGLDEKALEAVRQWRFIPAADEGQPADVFSSWEVDFRLSSGPSRWHLIRAGFRPPEGASRPVFSTVKYPAGVGIRPPASEAASEEAWVVSAIGRFAAAKVSFDIDEQGKPGNFRVESASEEMWGVEATHVISGWRFRPGTNNGSPVRVPCTVEMAWGRGSLRANIQAQLDEALNQPPPPSAPGICRTVQ